MGDYTVRLTGFDAGMSLVSADNAMRRYGEWLSVMEHGGLSGAANLLLIGLLSF